MAKPVSFTIVGGDKAAKMFSKYNLRSGREVSIALDDVALLLEAEIKQSIAGRRSEPTSVDTGQFMGNVQSEADTVSATVFSTVKQSLFMELGTSRIRPRRHFANSLSRKENVIIGKLSSGLKKAEK